MFEVGQRVVCVDDEVDYGMLPPSKTQWVAPKRGAIYTIAGPGTPRERRYPGEAIVRLVELRGPNDKGYLARRFEPLPKKTTNIEVFQRMLLPNADKVT